jgi:hypothetical protein
VIATTANISPTTPPTMAGMLVLWFVLLLIGLGVGGLGFGGEDKEHPLVTLHNSGFPKSLWYYHKDTSTNENVLIKQIRSNFSYTSQLLN